MKNDDASEFEVHVSIVKKGDATWVPPMSLSGHVTVQPVRGMDPDVALRTELAMLLSTFADIAVGSQYTVNGER